VLRKQQEYNKASLKDKFPPSVDDQTIGPVQEKQNILEPASEQREHHGSKFLL
jgi:hypothetical protein